MIPHRGFLCKSNSILILTTLYPVMIDLQRKLMLMVGDVNNAIIMKYIKEQEKSRTSCLYKVGVSNIKNDINH